MNGCALVLLVINRLGVLSTDDGAVLTLLLVEVLHSLLGSLALISDILIVQVVEVILPRLLALLWNIDLIGLQVVPRLISVLHHTAANETGIRLLLQ